MCSRETRPQPPSPTNAGTMLLYYHIYARILFTAPESGFWNYAGIRPRRSRRMVVDDYNRMYKSMHSILHSLRPSQLRSHSTPSPVHSSFLFASSSAAALARALAVVFNISTAVALKLSTESDMAVPLAGHSDVAGRGANQLLLKSKKHRSDQ